MKKLIGKTLDLGRRNPLVLLIVAFVMGIIFWGAFNTAMDMTNNESFCISCHEMRNNVYQEYKKTIHYSNRTGVRATCPDCHVPKDWVHMAMRKIGATNELLHKVIGSIDTRQKFLAKRLQLSQYVWRNMIKTDSRECRNCHSFDYMALVGQKQTSQQAHQRAVNNNLTCINCHMGVAHTISKDFDKDGKLHTEFKKQKRNCADCHIGMQQGEGW